MFTVEDVRVKLASHMDPKNDEIILLHTEAGEHRISADAFVERFGDGDLGAELANHPSATEQWRLYFERLFGHDT